MKTNTQVVLPAIIILIILPTIIALLAIEQERTENKSTDLTNKFENKEIAPVIKRPYLFFVDEAFKTYPFVLKNPLQKRDAVQAIYDKIIAHTNNPVSVIIGNSPMKLDQMLDAGDGQVYVSFEHKYNLDYMLSGTKRTIKINFRISAKVSREIASTLNTDYEYTIDGIFTGFPPRGELLPKFYDHELDLGVLEIKSASFQQANENQ